MASIPANTRLQDELKHLEEDVHQMVETVEFRNIKCQFQHKLRQEINKIKKSEDLIISAD